MAWMADRVGGHRRLASSRRRTWGEQQRICRMVL